jgi:hypothetical protein
MAIAASAPTTEVTMINSSNVIPAFDDRGFSGRKAIFRMQLKAESKR